MSETPTWLISSAEPQEGAQQTTKGQLVWGSEEISLGELRVDLDEVAGIQLSKSTTKGQERFSTRLLGHAPKPQHWLYLELRPRRGSRLRLKAKASREQVVGLPRLEGQGVEASWESLVEIVAWARQAGARVLEGISSPEVEASPVVLRPGIKWRLSTYIWWALTWGSVALSALVPTMATSSHHFTRSISVLVVFGLASAQVLAFRELWHRHSKLASLLKYLGAFPMGLSVLGAVLLAITLATEARDPLPILAGVVAWVPWGLRYGVGLWTSGHGELGREGFWFNPLWEERVEGRWDGDEVEVAKLISARGWALLDDADTLRDEAWARFEAMKSLALEDKE